MNLATLALLTKLFPHVQNNDKVTWENERGDLVCGTLRGFTTDTGAHFHGDDVMNAYVRVSATLEHFFTVPDVLAMMREGKFAPGYEL